jgi:hypothetical protein
MPTAATISVVACLLWAVAASAQTASSDPVWYPVGQGKPQASQPQAACKPQSLVPSLHQVETVQFKAAPELPTPFKQVETVQFKPVPELPTPLKQDKIAPPPVEQPGRIVVPQAMKNKLADDEGGLTIRTESPGLDRLTRRWSEDQFFESLRQDARRRPGMQRVYFPEEEPVSTEVYAGRHSPYMVRYVEPHYVTHGRLLFEQKNFERYGWDIGPLSPAVEFAMYYYDLALLPYHVGSHACACDTSAGKCLPGDATPLVIYREQFSITGLVFEGAAVFGGWFLFP